jgi:hypothetical protein
MTEAIFVLPQVLPGTPTPQGHTKAKPHPDVVKHPAK